MFPPKVFVSSTCYDLLDTRAQVKETLSSLGLRPVMSDAPEHFKTPLTTDSIETCLQNVDACDYFLIILCQRYGPNIPGQGKSATHLEFDRAVKKNKRILMFVRDRTAADADISEKNPDVEKLNWVRAKKDQRIFDIYREHKKLEQGRNNWFRTFQTSVDVCTDIEHFFRVQSNRIVLDKLVESGSLPVLVVSRHIAKARVHERDLWIIIEKIGDEPALDLEVTAITKKPKKPARIRVLSDCKHPPRLDLGRENPAKEQETRVVIDYTTRRGPRIRETFQLNPYPRLLSRRIIDRHPVAIDVPDEV